MTMEWERRVLLALDNVDGSTQGHVKAAITGLTPLLRVAVELYRLVEPSATDTPSNYDLSTNRMRVLSGVIDSEGTLRELCEIRPYGPTTELAGARFETITSADALVVEAESNTGDAKLLARFTAKPNVPLCDSTWEDAIALLDVRRLTKVLHDVAVDTG